MSTKKNKDCWILSYERMWESFLHSFILPSVANNIRTYVIRSAGLSDIEDCMYQAMILHFSKINSKSKKENLVFLMPPKIKKYIMESLYGNKIFKGARPKKLLGSFKGIEMFATNSVKHSILLINKEEGKVYIYYEHDFNKVSMEIEPVGENKWVKIVVPEDVE